MSHCQTSTNLCTYSRCRGAQHGLSFHTVILVSVMFDSPHGHAGVPTV